jgi:hypothetical protein
MIAAFIVAAQIVAGVQQGGPPRDAWPLRNQREEYSDVEVIISNKVTTVSGVLTDTNGAPLADGTVIVFSTESDKWSDASRFVRSARPDQQGKYQIKGLPPGEYLALAIDYVQDGMWNDPEYLESLRGRAQRFTLGETETRTVGLKLATVENP